MTGLEIVPLAYDAFGACSSSTRVFFDLLLDLVAPHKKDHFRNLSSLVLSVALAKSTARILLDKAEAAVVGDSQCYDLDFCEFVDDGELLW